MKILIADDHDIVREGMKRILSDAPDIEVVGEAENGQQVLDSVRSNQWDVIVLDINMPGLNGLETLKELKQEFVKLPVLVLSMYPEEQYGVRVMKAGAAGYLTKSSASRDLLQAVRKTAQGGKFISSKIADKLAEALEQQKEKPLHDLLSDREFEVFKMIGTGKTVGEIADMLLLSVKTVSTYRSKILEKTNFKNNAEIMQYAVQNGLID